MAARQVAYPGAIPGNRTSFIFDLRFLIFKKDCASARGRVSKTPLTPGSTEAVCQIKIGNRNSKILSGSWQTSNALALQASLCGSVTHRLQI